MGVARFLFPFSLPLFLFIMKLGADGLQPYLTVKLKPGDLLEKLKGTEWQKRGFVAVIGGGQSGSMHVAVQPLQRAEERMQPSQDSIAQVQDSSVR